MTERIESSFHPEHDITITEHGLGLDVNQDGQILHIDHSQFERLLEILLRHKRKVA